MFLDGMDKSIDFSCTENEVKFKNTSSLNPTTKDKEITIPYGTDLTNLGTDITNLETRLTTLENGSVSNNLITFHQSLIDNAILNNPNYGLNQLTMSEIKIYTPIKTLVGEDVFPKTTHTLLTAYYTSYIKTLPQIIDYKYKGLVRYFSTDDTYPAIIISAVNSTYYASPRLYIEIKKNNADIHKSYIITPITPKVAFDLTADLAACRSGQEIISAQFIPTGNPDTFYQHCVNILGNVFISYTYED
jgi:hypothetical protein